MFCQYLRSIGVGPSMLASRCPLIFFSRYVFVCAYECLPQRIAQTGGKRLPLLGKGRAGAALLWAIIRHRQEGGVGNKQRPQRQFFFKKRKSRQGKRPNNKGKR
nr:hypothetical protein [Pandoravirus aubagnensis]